MADYRTANPAYQLDVDTMMVDYTAYWAVDAKLKELKAALGATAASSSNNWKTEALNESAEAKTAERLVSTFDTLISLFHLHHPTAQISVGTAFNIKILEFLVLLGQCIYREPQPQPQRDEMRQHRLSSSIFRQKWLHAWCHNNQVQDSALKRFIAGIEDNNNPSNSMYETFLTQQADSPYIYLNDIQARFLDLSAEVSDCMGRVNEHWYKLAVRMMLQSAIERLSVLSNPATSLSPNTPNLAARWTSECFAWGSLQPCPFTSELDPNSPRNAASEDRIQEQIFISNTFRRRDSPTSDANPGSNTNPTEPGDKHNDTPMPDASPPSEDPTWTRLRTQAHTRILSLLQDTHATNRNHAHGHSHDRADGPRHINAHALSRLVEAHPLHAFLVDLRNFVDGIWCLNVDHLSGKPVLVQIEEGGIDGVSPSEFDAFLGRVGLKAGKGADGTGRGVVKWAR